MYDVIIVLGGGIDQNGNIHSWVKKRFDLAITYYQQYNIPIIPCSGVPYHNEPFLKNGHLHTEADAGAEYLLGQGVSREMILKEDYSRDTIGNAYFSLVMHVLPAQFKNILVITSQFHMSRSRVIFDWLYKLAGINDIVYKETDDGDLANIQPTYQLRLNREKKSTKNVLNLSHKYGTLEEVHKWLYSQHNAYSTAPTTVDTIDPKLKKSY